MNHRPFTISDAVRGVMNRKLYVISFFMVTCFLIGVATLVSPKTYKSQARLFMRLGRENTSLDATATLGESPVVMLPQSREAEINSIVELIQSKQLYEQVVDNVGAERLLDRDWHPAEADDSEEPSSLGSMIGSAMNWLAKVGVLNDLPSRERAVILLQKETEIEAFDQSNVLTISFKTHSPELAQLVVDQLVSIYQTHHVNLHRPPRAFEFLAEETARIDEGLNDARIALEAFKNKTGILEANQQRTVLIERIAKLEDDLLASESTEAALRSEVEQIANGLSSMSETTTMSTTTGAGNEAADGMRQELYRLQVMKEQFDSTYTANHPKVRQINDQINGAKEILEIDESKRKEMIVGPNKVFQELAMALEQKRPALIAEQTRIIKLREQIAETNATLNDFNANERQFAKLDRNVAIMEANYRKYFANLEQARIDNKMKTEEFSNLGIAQPATLNLKPHSPNKLINLLAAIFLGSTGGIGLAVFAEFLNPSVSSDEDVEQSIGATVIASIPSLTPDQMFFGNRADDEYTDGDHVAMRRLDNERRSTFDQERPR